MQKNKEKERIQNDRLIMLIVGFLLFMGIMSLMSSCTIGPADKPHNKQIVFRGKSTSSGIVAPITLSDSTYNVYDIGDTVWVNNSTNVISKATWNLSNHQAQSFTKFVILDRLPMISDKKKEIPLTTSNRLHSN